MISPIIIHGQAELPRHEHAGIIPNPFVRDNQYRLKMASDLLLTTRDSIQAIAEAVGFTNAFNFSTSFKRYFGLSPSQWRYHEQ